MITQWLTDQQQQGNNLYVMLDPLAEPNPVATLLINQAIKNYAWLYQHTPYENLKDYSPTLIEITDIHNQGLQELINHPEQNWGWLFSASQQIPFENLINHWRARITLIYEGQEVFYRFQDNRVIARALNTIPQDKYYQLLGQINQVALWDEDHWQSYSNLTPLDYPLTSKENLVWALPEPEYITKQIRFDNLYDWVINTFTDKVFNEVKPQMPFKQWLTEQIDLLDTWQWHQREQALFMLEQRLDYEQRQSEQWQPLPEETPTQHYERVKTQFNKQLPRQPLCTELDTAKL